MILLALAVGTGIYIRKALKMTGTAGVRIEISEPIVVAQNDTEHDEWGFFQFPKLYRTVGEKIVCKIACKADAYDAYTGDYQYFVSDDGGMTWNSVTYEPVDCSIIMQNGKALQGPVFQDGEPDNGLEEKYNPIYSFTDENGSSSYIFAAGTINYTDADRKIELEEYDFTTASMNRFITHVSWPYEPLIVDEGWVSPASSIFHHFRMHGTNCVIQESNGALFWAAYSPGMDQDGADTNGFLYNIYCFRSNDSGRNCIRSEP